jgi:D-3-phosphoglycerate dehydrogenase
MTKILLTTTSYQDIPGPHHDLLDSAGAEIHRERGPLSEAQMLELAGDFDAFLCGDDMITQAVIDKSLPRLKIISKYGIGVDKIDVKYATEKGIPLTFCPGVNHTTVAEHTFVLMLSLSRKFVEEVNYVREGNWKRLTGNELMGKKIGVVGLGRIGKEVTTRAKAFGMPVMGYDLYWPEEFANEHGVEKASSLEDIFKTCDIVSLHTSLNHPLLKAPNCVITPHIGSRTFESVERQAMMATQNLLNCLKGEKPLAQVNDAPIPDAII